jgi:hypothetical protein
MRNQRIEKLKNILQKKTIDRSIMRRSLVSYRYIIINYKKKNTYLSLKFKLQENWTTNPLMESKMILFFFEISSF